MMSSLGRGRVSRAASIDAAGASAGAPPAETDGLRSPGLSPGAGVPRRVALGSLVGAGLLALAGGTAAAAQGDALVYRGPASTPGTAEAAADAIRSRGALNPSYVGPGERIQLTASALRNATLYVQPGGDTVAGSWPSMRPYRNLIVDWVHDGGHYLGLCLGAYLAADDPGFGLWPGDVWDYKRADGTDIPTESGLLTTIQWRGRPRTMYVQDPPVFTVRPGTHRLAVLARYGSGHIAAASVPVGHGRVTLVGPHPEAPPSWYSGGPRRWQPGAWIDTERSAIAP